MQTRKLQAANFRYGPSQAALSAPEPRVAQLDLPTPLIVL
jgi:hypothetical protein